MHFVTSVVAEAVLMIGGCAQGHLVTEILLGVDQGPTAQATRQHLSESTIQGMTCFHPPTMCWWKLHVLVMSQFKLIGSPTFLTGPRLLDLERDLCCVHQLTADQGVQAPVLAGLLGGRDLSLLASEVPQVSMWLSSHCYAEPHMFQDYFCQHPRVL